jgi:hypothetical protein
MKRREKAETSREVAKDAKGEQRRGFQMEGRRGIDG